MRNNYDCNSKGINIEYLIYFSSGLAHDTFEENFESIGNNVWLYTEYGNLSSEIPTFGMFHRLTDGQEEELKKTLLNLHYDYEEEILEFFDKHTDMNDVLYDLMNYGVYDDFKHLYNDLIAEGLEFETDYRWFITRGYNQGDCAKIFINVKEFEEVHGCEFDSDWFKKHIHSLCWDLPLIFFLTVNGYEYYSDFDGCYTFDNYNKQKEIENIIKTILEQDSSINADLLKEELEKIIPEDLCEVEVF